MSAEDFAPLRELAEFDLRDGERTLILGPVTQGLLARLLREHAERGEAINTVFTAWDARFDLRQTDEWTDDADRALTITYNDAMKHLRSLSSSPHPTDNPK